VLKQRDIQVERLSSMLDKPVTNDPKVKQDIDKRNGLLGRMFTAIALNDLKMNGQPPNQDYQLAEHLTHGGRIFFYLSNLDANDQIAFKQWLKGDAPIKQRTSATHAIGYDKNNQPMDVKTSPSQAFGRSMIAKAKGKPTHYGMDVHAGGYGKNIKNYKGETKTVFRLLVRGLAYHHADCPISFLSIIEQLDRLIRV
jgi:hypothetical protein